LGQTVNRPLQQVLPLGAELGEEAGVAEATPRRLLAALGMTGRVLHGETHHEGLQQQVVAVPRPTFARRFLAVVGH
jgi:hypothetical protein